MNDQKKSYDQLNEEARHKLIELAIQMQLLLQPSDVAHLFLGAGLGVLLGLGEDVTRRWLEKALEGLDDDPTRLH
jgi:hypothetical protein